MERPNDQSQVVAATRRDAGDRLDRLLARALPTLSRSRLKVLIQTGQVTSGGVTIAAPSYRVKPGQRFAILVPPADEPAPQAQALPLSIVYEDADVIVVDKPAGLVVHPAPGNPNRTLVNALIAHCGDSLSGIGGVRRPGIVHRLDKDTSGSLVAAKTDRAQQALTAQFAAHTIERAYWAVAWGLPAPRRGEISGAIGRHPRNRKKMAVVTRGGKPALTRYRMIKALGGVAALLECRLATGRTHQIRVHLASRGHPLVGDPLYGGSRHHLLETLPGTVQKAVNAFARQALHARLIGFRHPGNNKSLQFTSDLPFDLKALISCLESL